MGSESAREVAEANRRFYDRIAAVYDEVDTRRGDKVDHAWLDRVLADACALLATTGRSPATFEFLDAGAGSGFLSRYARKHFSRITLLDISKPMLEAIHLPGARRLQAGCEALPFRDASVDFVGAFATLHHLHSPEALFREAARVLRPGGVFYSDHDIERGFVDRFRLPLRLYRSFFDHGHGYLERCPEASARDYALSEFHGDEGLDSEVMAGQIRSAGLRLVVHKVHWEGMGLLGTVVRRAGLTSILERRFRAPVTRIVAVKP